MNSCTTYLNVKRRLDHQIWLRQSWKPMRLLGVLVELMKRSWTCLSHQKVEGLSKVEKPQKPEKSAKTIGLGELSFLTSDTRLAFTNLFVNTIAAKPAEPSSLFAQSSALLASKYSKTLDKKFIVTEQFYALHEIFLFCAFSHSECRTIIFIIICVLLHT